MKDIPIKEMTRERLEVEYANLLELAEIKDGQLATKDKEIELLKGAIHIIKRRCYSCESMETGEDCYYCDVFRMVKYLS